MTRFLPPVPENAFRSAQMRIAVGSGAMTIFGIVAAVLEVWAAAAAAGLGLLAIVVALAAHNHRRLAYVLELSKEYGGSQRPRVATGGDSLAKDHVRRLLENHADVIHTQLSTRLDLLEEHFHDLVQVTTTTIRHVAESEGFTRSDARIRDLDEAVARIGDELSGHSASLEKQIERVRQESIAETDALAQLHRRFPFPPEASSPLVGGWALTPSGLLQVVDHVHSQTPSTIVECGSGTSTVYLALACQRAGVGRVIALEHSQRYAEPVRQHLSTLDLDANAEVRVAELSEVQGSGQGWNWYDPAQWQDLDDIGLLLIDGPPGGTSPKARYPALPALAPHLADGCVIIVDDARREAEREIIAQWLQEFPLARLPSLSPDQAVLRWAPEEPMNGHSSLDEPATEDPPTT